MNASKEKKILDRRIKNLFLKGVVAFFAAAFLVHNGTPVSAKEKAGSENVVEKGFALNLNGREIGSVDTEGNIFNRYGEIVGSVDEKGDVFNIGKTLIGKVDPRGEVRNQTGTLLGYADEQGNVYNRLRKKVGSVEGIGGLTFIGGAARLLFFKGR